MNSQDNLNNLSQETINKLNNLGNHVVGSLFDIATPILNTVTNMNIPENEDSMIKNNIKESESMIKIILWLPGVRKEDIDIILENNFLKIKAKTTINDIDWDHIKDKTFSKNIKIPENIIHNDLAVKYENGILKILINKKNCNPEEGTKIEIN